LPRNAVQSIEGVGIGESKWKFQFKTKTRKSFGGDVFVLASQNLNQEDPHFIQSKQLVKGIEGE
jgi:hypothetical protein